MSGKEAREVAESEYCQVSLRIKHPSIDPEQISNELSIIPEHAWACGEPRLSDSGAVLGGTRRNSYWSARLSAATWSDISAALLSAKEWRRPAARELPPTLAEAAQEVTTFGNVPSAMVRTPAWQLFVQVWRLKKHRAFFDRIESEGGEISLAVEVESGSSLTIEPLLGRLIADLGLRVEFEVA